MKPSITKSELLSDLSINAKRLDTQFHEIYQSFSDRCQEDINKLKQLLFSDKSESMLSTEIWESINTHLNYIQTQIVTLEEKYLFFKKHPFLQEWKDESVVRLNQLPEKLAVSFKLGNLKPLESDNLKHRIIKKGSGQYYRFVHNFLKVISKEKNYLNSGRKAYIRNFFHYYIILPGAQFLLDQWNDYLSIIIQNIALWQKTTEQLKDELLASEKIADKNIYWRKVINPDLRSIIENYGNTVKKTEQSNKTFSDAVLTKLQTVIDEMTEKSDTYLDLAGTFLLQNRNFNYRKINKQWRLISKKQRKSEESWTLHFRTLKDDWLKDIDLAKIQLTVAVYWFETGHIIRNKFYSDVVPLFREIVKKLKETRKSISEDITDIADRAEIKNKMILLNRNLVRTIRDKNLPDVLNLLDPESFSQSFSGFIKRINADSESLADEHTVLAYIDLQNLPSRIKSDKVALKDLLQADTFYSVEQKLEDITSNLGLELDAASRSLARMDQVIEYNLEGALNLIRELEDEQSWQKAIDVTQQGLERIEQNIEDLIGSLKTRIDDSLKKFDRIAADLEEDIQILGDNEELLKLKIRLTRARTKAKLVELRKESWQYMRLFIPELLRLLRSSFVKIRERYSKVQRMAGLAVPDRQSEVSFTQYLTDVEKKFEQMPYIYQRIFRIEPLEDNKFFIGREIVLETLSQDFEDLKNNYHPVTALVGEKGSGKTSTLNFAKRNIFKGFPVTDINITHTINTGNDLDSLIRQAFKLPDVQSVHEVITILNTQREKRICILENVHNLFLRNIDGFRALDELFLLISKTRQNLFWIVSCGKYAWEYLDTVTKISSFFKRIIRLEDLSTQELKQMILDRHQISGYGINFLPTTKIAESRPYKKLNTALKQQQYLQEYFFKRLSEAAEGNIRVAIYFWLSAIDEFEESVINVLLDIKFESQFLHQLPIDEILSLAAFIQHEYLTEAEHAEIFNQSLNDSSIFIENMYKKGLLVRNGENFLIHPYLYRPVVRALQLRNII